MHATMHVLRQTWQASREIHHSCSVWQTQMWSLPKAAVLSLQLQQSDQLRPQRRRKQHAAKFSAFELHGSLPPLLCATQTPRATLQD